MTPTQHNYEVLVSAIGQGKKRSTPCMHVTRVSTGIARETTPFTCVYTYMHMCVVSVIEGTNSEVRGHLHLTTDVPGLDMCCQILLYVGSQFHSQHGKNKTQPYGQAPRQISTEPNISR